MTEDRKLHPHEIDAALALYARLLGQNNAFSYQQTKTLIQLGFNIDEDVLDIRDFPQA